MRTSVGMNVSRLFFGILVASEPSAIWRTNRINAVPHKICEEQANRARVGSSGGRRRRAERLRIDLRSGAVLIY